MGPGGAQSVPGSPSVGPHREARGECGCIHLITSLYDLDMRIEVEGVRLWFDVDGAGLVPHQRTMRTRPTVVLLHGGPGGFDHSYFKPDFSRLTEIAQVVYLDLPGHGRSDWGAPDDWSFEWAADLVHAFCEALEVSKPIVLGHSFGGPVAMSYGSRHADHPGGLILQSAMARFDLDRVTDGFRDEHGEEIADIVRRSYLGDPSVTSDQWARCWALFGPWVPGQTEKARIPRNEALNVAGGELMLAFDLTSDLARVRAPTLVSVGELDPITPVWAAETIVDGLPDGTGHLDVIEGAGHFPWRDRPDRYWSSIKRFVISVAEAG